MACQIERSPRNQGLNVIDRPSSPRPLGGRGESRIACHSLSISRSSRRPSIRVGRAGIRSLARGRAMSQSRQGPTRTSAAGQPSRPNRQPNDVIKPSRQNEHTGRPNQWVKHRPIDMAIQRTLKPRFQGVVGSASGFWQGPVWLGLSPRSPGSSSTARGFRTQPQPRGFLIQCQIPVAHPASSRTPDARGGPPRGIESQTPRGIESQTPPQGRAGGSAPSPPPQTGRNEGSAARGEKSQKNRVAPLTRATLSRSIRVCRQPTMRDCWYEHQRRAGGFSRSRKNGVIT